MDNILNKLEGIISSYLDEIEKKPIKTLVISVVVYYLFKRLIDNKR